MLCDVAISFKISPVVITTRLCGDCSLDTALLKSTKTLIPPLPDSINMHKDRFRFPRFGACNDSLRHVFVQLKGLLSN